MRAILYTLAFLSITLLTVYTNTHMVLDPAGFHHRGTVWLVESVWTIIGTAMLAMWLPCRRSAFFCGLLGGAVMVSVGDAVSHHMNVRNQFSIICGLGDDGVYFNIADVAIYTSIVVLGFCTVREFLRRRREVMEQNA